MDKILVISNHNGEDYTDIAFSFYRAFKAVGKIVLTYDLNPKIKSRLLNKVLKTLNMDSLTILKINEELVRFLSSNFFDLIFVVKGTYLLPETIDKIKNINHKMKIICFNPDDPFNEQSSNVLIANSISHYDYYLMWSEKLRQNIQKKYHIKTIYLPFAVDAEIIYALENTTKEITVSFIGNGDKYRNLWLTQLDNLVDKKIPNLSFHIYGDRWQTFRAIRRHRQVNGVKFLEIFNQTKINLNILRLQNKNSINMRTFEIPGTRSFMLHEYSEEAMEFFKPGIEAEYFKDSGELVDKIIFYLSHENARIKIAQEGYNRVLNSNYNYKFLFKNLLKNLE